MKKYILLTILYLLLAGVSTYSTADSMTLNDYQRATWDPIHFSPAIDTASDSQCLRCHKEILERRPLPTTPSGVPTGSMKAWYQALATYEGPQETFHRRHLITTYANTLMDMKCITCHQGEDIREEAPVPPDTNQTRFTLRKQVNTDICLACHGAFPDYTRMGLPSHWSESSELFQNDCLACHADIRTTRHQVNYLKADAIEAMAREKQDVCYGCHGGRQWYRISYPYPRHSWKDMPEKTPDWAKERPTESDPRFRLKQ